MFVPRWPASSFVEWTRHYERKMGLPTHRVSFEALEKCGQVELDPYSGLLVSYDPTKGCEPREVALHEACHLRYAHLFVPLTDEEKHREVAECARHYR